jgi:hypothetical protein
VPDRVQPLGGFTPSKDGSTHRERTAIPKVSPFWPSTTRWMAVPIDSSTGQQATRLLRPPLPLPRLAVVLPALVVVAGRVLRW